MSKTRGVGRCGTWGGGGSTIPWSWVGYAGDPNHGSYLRAPGVGGAGRPFAQDPISLASRQPGTCIQHFSLGLTRSRVCFRAAERAVWSPATKKQTGAPSLPGLGLSKATTQGVRPWEGVHESSPRGPSVRCWGKDTAVIHSSHLSARPSVCLTSHTPRIPNE